LGGDTRDAVDLDSRRQVPRRQIVPLAMRPSLEPVALDAALFISFGLAHWLYEHHRVEVLGTAQINLQPAGSLPFRKVKS
jgi:hypothetical protein